MRDKTVFDLTDDCPAFSAARKIFEDTIISN